jgi:hypothetical protein
MDYSVWFRGAHIGGVSFGPPDANGNRLGPFRPTDSYWDHRPELQSLTLGLAALDGAPVEQLAAGWAAAVERISAGSLELRDNRGIIVDTEWLMVADYAPADLAPALRNTMPILVSARLSVRGDPGAAF